MWNPISRAIHPDLYSWPETQSVIEKRELEADRMWQGVFTKLGFPELPTLPPPKPPRRPVPKGRIRTEMDGRPNVDLD